MSCVSCDDVCVSIVGVCILSLWGLSMCVIMDKCEANDLVGAFGKISKKLCRYDKE